MAPPPPRGVLAEEAETEGLVAGTDGDEEVAWETGPERVLAAMPGSTFAAGFDVSGGRGGGPPPASRCCKEDSVPAEAPFGEGF